MDTQQIKSLQADLASLGFDPGPLDGVFGVKTAAAWNAAMAAIRRAKTVDMAIPTSGLAWGARVSSVFRARVRWMADELKMPKDGASWLMACMAWESAETFRSDTKNMAGSGATGLIQFMPTTAVDLGTTTADLARMTPEDQLNYVYKYFKPYAGRLNNLGDVYMAILWPAGVGKPDSYVLWDKNSRPTTYRQNAGLDIDKDGSITRFEAVSKVHDKLEKGLRAPFVFA